MSLLKSYVKKYKGEYLQSIFLAILGVLFSLLSYVLLSNAVGVLVNNNHEIEIYIKLSLFILATLVFKEVFAAWSTSVSHKVTFKVLGEIRMDISEKLYKMPMGDIMDMNSGRLKDIIVDQVDSTETSLAHIVPEFTANLLGPILLIIYMLVLDWRLTLISFIPVIVGIFFMKNIMANYGENYAKSVEINQGMNNAVVEYINGIKVIKTFNQNEKSYKKFQDLVYENAQFYYNWMKQSMLGMSIFKKLSSMSLITIIPFGIYFYINGTLDIVTFITVMILSFGTIENILAASNYVDDLARIGTIVGEILIILDNRELVHGESKVQMKDYNIKFENVSFAYEKDKKVLDNLNLCIKDKDVTALVGPSGGGKSTITKLIAGFWDVDSGDITIGGIKLKDIPLEQLSEFISYVFQDNYLFDLSVRDNIRIGNPNASDKEVEEMAEKSGCGQFISELEEGYDTIVGDGGGHLSGGEKQRVSIARAMLKDAPIVILDEATAYIDTENESIIQKAISNLVKDKTLIIVAHRLRTIIDADKIVVVENGKIKNEGTHMELLKDSPLYQEMWASTIRGEGNDD